MQSLLNRGNIYTSSLPAGFDIWCKRGEKTAHHSLAYPDRGDIRKLLMFSLALSPTVALSLYSLRVEMQEQSSCSVASHVSGSHFNIWSERSGWYILSCRGDSDLHATSSRWYTFTRPTQPVEQTDNESICMKHLWVTPPHPSSVRPIRASLMAPAVWVREAPCIVISIFLSWSPAEASPAALSTHC